MAQQVKDLLLSLQKLGSLLWQGLSPWVKGLLHALGVVKKGGKRELVEYKTFMKSTKIKIFIENDINVSQTENLSVFSPSIKKFPQTQETSSKSLN